MIPKISLEVEASHFNSASRIGQPDRPADHRPDQEDETARGLSPVSLVSRPDSAGLDQDGGGSTCLRVESPPATSASRSATPAAISSGSQLSTGSSGS